MTWLDNPRSDPTVTIVCGIGVWVCISTTILRTWNGISHDPQWLDEMRQLPIRSNRHNCLWSWSRSIHLDYDFENLKWHSSKSAMTSRDNSQSYPTVTIVYGVGVGVCISTTILRTWNNILHNPQWMTWWNDSRSNPTVTIVGVGQHDHWTLQNGAQLFVSNFGGCAHKLWLTIIQLPLGFNLWYFIHLSSDFDIFDSVDFHFWGRFAIAHVSDPMATILWTVGGARNRMTQGWATLLDVPWTLYSTRLWLWILSYASQLLFRKLEMEFSTIHNCWLDKTPPDPIERPQLCVELEEVTTTLGQHGTKALYDRQV